MCRRYLVISDVDGTLLGDPEALVQLQAWLEQQPLLITWVYSSGRFFDSVGQSVKQHHLTLPAAIIGGVGTEIVQFANGLPLDSWRNLMADRFSTIKIRQALSSWPQLELQPEEFQSPYKVSYYWFHASRNELQQLARHLAPLGLDLQIVYSSDRDLDLLPARANKGNAARFLAEFWGYPAENVLVAGDSGNDLAMFQAGFRGIVVGNAAPELRSLSSDQVFLATDHFAAGVLQGLEFWLAQDRSSQEKHFDNAKNTV